jgi:hypothetical protein
MKAAHDTMQNPQVQSIAADFAAARLWVLFEQYPMLSGYSVQERSTLTRDRAMVQLAGELWLADVSMSSDPGFGVTLEIYQQIARTLLGLMEGHPAAFALLPGRTIARAFH